MVGQTISHYKITEKLGEGGMGVVYKAEDANLKRSVALKFLAAQLLGDEKLKVRFRREAEAAASLNHQNICHVYEISEIEGKTFIAMAFLEGEGLDKRIAAGPLKLKDAFDIAIQTAKGLQAAHSKGIVHRDIKPANLMAGPDGQVTIMDFGLAQLSDRSKLTRVDETMGTVTYMSPEQTFGAEIDHRSDIWSLGVVIFEMVTGQRPFKGHYDKAVMYSITNEEPEPMTALRTGVPMALEWLVNKCLAKEPDRRYQSTGDMVVDLETLRDKLNSGKSMILRTGVVAPGTIAGPAQRSEQSAGQARPQPGQGESSSRLGQAERSSLRPEWKRMLPWAVAAVMAVVALAVSFLHLRETRPQTPVFEIELTFPSSAQIRTFSLSPNGRHLAVAMQYDQGEEFRRKLWVRSMDTRELRDLPGTEGAQYPFWSPDSRYLGFFAQGKLKRVALAGGPPQSLCDAEDGRGGSWNPDGVIVFSPSAFGQIQRVAEGGGEPVAVTKEGESGSRPARRFPWFLPDGKHFLYSYTVGEADPERVGIYLGSIDGMESRRVLSDDSNAIYVPGVWGRGGFILFVREDALMAQPFDPGGLTLAGDVFPVLESVGRAFHVGNFTFSASARGSLIYSETRFGAPRQLAWVDRSGKQLEVLGKPARIHDLSLSLDQTTAALVLESGNDRPDIWLFELARGTLSRFTSHPAPDFAPLWSPDGAHIAFASVRNGPTSLYQKGTAGTGEAVALLPNTSLLARPRDWSPDGRFLLFEAQQPRTGIDIWVLPLEGDRKPFALLETQFDEEAARFSPDGRWVAYESDESGISEIYVQPFPAADRKSTISTKGGSNPSWSKDGRELYYIAPDKTLMAVPVTAGETIEAGAPQELFQTRLPDRARGGRYEVSADGKRFLIATDTENNGENAGRSLVLISDWQAKLGN